MMTYSSLTLVNNSNLEWILSAPYYNYTFANAPAAPAQG